MLALADWNEQDEQAELFPSATKQDLKVAKSLLSRYRRMKMIVDDFDRDGTNVLAEKQLNLYNAFKRQINRVDRAVNLIIDEDIKRMIELRYVKGQPHHITVSRFELWHPSTVDRKINKGIESVANTLVLWD